MSNTYLSAGDRHEAGTCGGVGDLCEFCDQAMAARIKARDREGVSA